MSRIGGVAAKELGRFSRSEERGERGGGCWFRLLGQPLYFDIGILTAYVFKYALSGEKEGKGYIRSVF